MPVNINAECGMRNSELDSILDSSSDIISSDFDLNLELGDNLKKLTAKTQLSSNNVKA